MTKKQKKVLYRILITVVLMGLLWGIPFFQSLGWWIYLLPYLVIGYDILKKAFQGIRNRQVFDENFLMAVATIGAFVLGEYAEGTAVMLFYQIGELFQSYAVGKSRRNIAALMDIRPDYANVLTEDGNEVQADPDEVLVGSMIIVRPGEKIPIDGVIVEGTSALNTVALTGESAPKEVGEADEVISGCINLSGLLKIRTTKEFGESTVSKILELVENSGMKKARTEKFISRFARYYTPFVCIAAAGLAFLPPIVCALMGKEVLLEQWVIRGLTFLVISCPCALVISIPLSFFGGIGGAGAKGILIKGANYLEALAKADTIVFDKTGTLTQGVFHVTKVEPATEEITGEQLVEWAAYAEFYSNHPISKSLREYYDREVAEERIGEVREISGHGMMIQMDGTEVAAGNRKLMESLGIVPAAHSQDGTVVYVATDGLYRGMIVISDVVKKEAKRAIALLRKMGVRRTVMLTGDAEAVAQRVGKELEITEVYSELLPAQKVEYVEAFLVEKSKKGSLVFVGDGINDAPVLARADIGIAMGAMGSDAAIEAADVVLMDDNPQKIALAIRIARKCLGIVYQNIIFALGVKGVCLILGAVGIANMWLAIFADVGVMILAVLNATRCLRIGKRR